MQNVFHVTIIVETEVCNEKNWVFFTSKDPSLPKIFASKDPSMFFDKEGMALQKRKLLSRCSMCIYACVLSHFSCVQLFAALMNCNLPGSSVHGILQARMLEWVATSYSSGSSQPRDQTQVSCIAGGFFTS